MKHRIITALLIVATLSSFTGCFWSDDANLKEVVFKTNSGDHSYKVEVADNQEEREKGLMYRDSMGDDRGMIFVYEAERSMAFWMKNTLISLDIIFLNKDFKVVDYFENVPPCKIEQCPHYIPNNMAQYAVELNAGQADKILLSRGDFAEYK